MNGSLIKSVFIISVLIVFFFNFNVYSQTWKDTTKNSKDLQIFVREDAIFLKNIEYYYEGKRYTLDYRAKHFMSIVKDSPEAVKEVKKYRFKRILVTTLRVSSVGFFIVGAASENNKDLVYIGLTSAIAAYIILSSRDKEILKASRFHNRSNEVSKLTQFLNLNKSTSEPTGLIGVTFKINL